MTKADAEITGVCPECKYLYTERIHPFPSDSLPCCPKCGSKRRPYPVGAAGLPSPPDLIPISPKDAFSTTKTSLLLLLLPGGYRLGTWMGPPPPSVEQVILRQFTMGDPTGRGAGTFGIAPKEIEAAWEFGDRPGHHG